MTRIATLAAALVAASAAAAAAQDGPTLTVETEGDFGAYIAGPGGKPVYLFTTDEQGQGAEEPRISCTSEACLQMWPLVTAEDPTVGPQLEEDLVGSTTYEGESVVTYNGWPLYFYAPDTAGAAPTGQDIHSFGGEWYLLTPQGEKLEREG